MGKEEIWRFFCLCQPLREKFRRKIPHTTFGAIVVFDWRLFKMAHFVFTEAATDSGDNQAQDKREVAEKIRGKIDDCL